ncbi:unnamed protein product [Clonostachys rosea]|uniref:Carrier domain-containing protein n=1 Tax=Bionectria ochroleuca TaxID=29856 RepID=A0ABY6U747_BIOOC|nr:unnamed protein product [Clonostachys rosea]
MASVLSATAPNGLDSSSIADATAVHPISESDSETGHNQNESWPARASSASSVDSNGPNLGTGDASSTLVICGMAMRLPGNINSEDQFWDFLVNKRDARDLIPESRYNAAAFFGDASRMETDASAEHETRFINDTEITAASEANTEAINDQAYGYTLNQVDLSQFDASFFSMTRQELEWTDPQQRLLLELTRECLENSGELNWRGKEIGCYVGVFGEDWLDIHSKDPQELAMYKLTGHGDFLLGNRISYEYDFKGPSMTIRTGCSSALVGMDLACKALRAGQINAAVVAGSNLILSPSTTQLMFKQGVLSPDVSCKTFDEKANGYARAEGINMLYVKRLEDALRDGNPIRAVIRSTASNSDGKTMGLSHPSTAGHEALIRSCYETAGISDYCRTAFFECHGTGTSTGDPVELTAVANVFKERGIYIGSIKPNLGHSEGASGLTGVIKAILALENRTIPPNIKYSKPNPRIPFKEGRLSVPVDNTPWPEDRDERVSVNSFGLGGSNAHIILDSARSIGIGSEDISQPQEAKEQKLLVFTANHPDSAQKGAELYSKFAEEHSDKLDDLEYTLALRREHLPYRTFAVYDGTGTPEFSLATKIPLSSPTVAFVFTGQGAQWATMGRRLLTEFASAQKDVESLDEALSKVVPAPSWTIQGELQKDAQDTRVGQAEFSQPLCTAVQIIIVNLLRRWGIEPAAVVGHSSGEIAASYAAGALTMDEAIVCSYLRGLVTKQQQRRGGMAAIGLGRDAVQQYLVDGVVVACENSPASVTLSGDEDKIDSVIEAIKNAEEGVLARRLKVEMAYHSSHMQEIGDAYEQMLLPSLSAKSCLLPLYSTVTGRLMDSDSTPDAKYWRSNLESPVLFNTAVTQLIKDLPSENLVLLEIGPHSALAGPIRQITKAAKAKSVTYIPTLIRNEVDSKSILNTAGQLFQKGAGLDLKTITKPGAVLTNTPTYPWHHDTKYWAESRVSKEWRQRTFPHHELLGARVIEGSQLEPMWRNVLRLDQIPWCKDHMLGADIIFPAAGYMVMALEAMRQVSGTEDYSLRNVTLKSALVMLESSEVETMFSLRPLRLTHRLDSIWHEFNISSYNGTTWTKHCAGQIRAGSDNPPQPRVISHHPRKIHRESWYQTMREAGLNYGPFFQGLQQGTSHPLRDVAAAHLSNNIPGIKQDPHPHHFHAATIDSCLQLYPAATARGLARDFGKMSVPAFVGEIYIRRPTPSGKVSIEVNAENTAKGAIHGDCLGVSDTGEVVLQLKDVRLTPMDDGNEAAKRNSHSAVRLQWKPDIYFQDMGKMVTSSKHIREPYWPLQKLVLLCCVEARDRLASLPPSPLEHMRKFQTWVAKQVEEAESNGYLFVDDVKALTGLPSAERAPLIAEYAQQLRETQVAPVGIAVWRVFNDIEGIYSGEVDPLAILRQDDILTKLYNLADAWDYSPFLRLLRHRTPHLRVLEIGAGTGATTELILQGLISDSGERMYFSYTYTDISAGFFPAAKERFKNAQAMEFRPLDISETPESQGFTPHSYDLVVATNVLHATPCLKETLANINQLLKPDGKLLMQELCTSTRWVNYAVGVLPGWWLGEADNRPEEPYVSIDRWTKELTDAGFSGADAIIVDDEMPFQTNATFIASPAVDHPKATSVSLLSRNPEGPTAKALSEALQSQGLAVEFASLSDKPHQGVISILDLEGSSILEDISAETYADLKAFLLETPANGLLWLTKPCQIQSTEPQYAAILGLTRVLRNELGVNNLVTLELDDHSSPEAIKSIGTLYQRMQQKSNEADEVDADCEYAFSNGSVNIPRFKWISVPDELATKSDKGLTPKALEIGKRGSLKSLQWVDRPEIQLEGDEVAVQVRAVGMNFKDILIAMGVVDGSKEDGNGLGFECAGIIQGLGPDVPSDLKVGDRVMVFAGNSYSTVMKIPAVLCIKMPDTLSFEEAASMPCVYGTVVYGLQDLARLEAGQSVLIHSACGGVGIAAIQICRMLGAEIFATVGNDEKVQYLQDTFNIPRNRIFNSRDSSFYAGVMRETNGEGVDVVLNSLSGDLLHASWDCVAKFGSMIELGKRDFIGQGRLAMDPFEDNRAFFGVHVAPIVAERPNKIRTLLKRCMDFYSEGLIGPIRPVTVFDAVNIQEAFRTMSKGQHIGKLVVHMPEDPSVLNVTAVRNQFKLRPDVSYLLVGGLGGLGRSMSTWMAEKGAKNLIYLSRGATSKADETINLLVEELAAAGCTVQLVQGSVTNLDDLERVKSEARLPIAGIINASMVLRDSMFADMNHEDWEAAAAPKVKGTWNLHKAFKDYKLDFFVLYSSFSGLVGQRGQANYASANTFLDAFVQFRHGQGLAASVLDIGAMADVGYVSRNARVMENFRAASVEVLRERHLLDALELAMMISEAPATQATESDRGYVSVSQIGLGLRTTQPIASPNNRVIWRRDPRMGLYRNIEEAVDGASSGGSQEQDALRSLLAEADGNPDLLKEAEFVTSLATQIGTTLFNFMMKPLDELDLAVPLANFGIDSLVGIELRSWFRQRLSLDVSVLEIMNSESLISLAEFVANGLLAKLDIGAPEDEKANSK